MIEVGHPDVLCERSGVVAVAKPPGLPTQAPPGIPSVESWLRARLPSGAYVGIPHRLDRPVSGVLLLAVTPRAARQLSRQFERRQVAKAYVALVAVGPDADSALPEEGEERLWTDSIGKVPEEARGRIVAATDPEGRGAETVVRRAGIVPAAGEGARALLRLEPRTGRMHQLRIQAAARGLPILGDALYGGPAFVVGGAVDPREAPIALHARSIRFRDPDGDEAMEIVAPLPGFWPADVRRLLD